MSSAPTRRARPETGTLLAFAIAGALMARPIEAASAALPSVVSINLCTDPLLVRLADPGQVRGLSPYARDRVRSWSRDEGARFPIVGGTAEEVLTIRPDLVLAGRFTKRATRELLRQHGVRLVELEPARTMDDARAQIREVGKLLGHPDRAEAAVARIDAAIKRARRAAALRPLSVLPLQRRGWVSGEGTLLTSLLRVVGLDNAGAGFSRGIGRQVALETVVKSRPDLLLVTDTSAEPEDQGSALLRHPALETLYPPSKRIVLPENLNLLCGGPTLAEAVEAFAAAVERVR